MCLFLLWILFDTITNKLNSYTEVYFSVVCKREEVTCTKL